MSRPRWGRGARRRAWYGLLTALGLAERGYFIPYRYAGALSQAAPGAPYAAAEQLFDACRARFRGQLEALDGLAGALLRIGAAPAEPAGAPRWTQDWFPRLDAALAYALVRRIAPARVVEVGCGHSTRFVLRACADGGLATRVTAIDPAPRADFAASPGVTLEFLRGATQQVGPAPFAGLGAGDIVMIDSSHILMPGSDVDFLFGRILPALPPGLHLQLHDVFLPDDYPADWAWRGYNEQLAALQLLLGRDWEPVFASHYVATRMAEAVAASAAGRLPLPEGARESSLWLRRRPPAAATSQ